MIDVTEEVSGEWQRERWLRMRTCRRYWKERETLGYVSQSSPKWCNRASNPPSDTTNSNIWKWLLVLLILIKCLAPQTENKHRHLMRRLQASLRSWKKQILANPSHRPTLSRRSELSTFQLQTLDQNLSRLFAPPARYSDSLAWKCDKNCLFFQASVTTTTDSRPSMMAWAISFAICFTMCWPCFCVPFCVDSFKDVKHSCPNCNITLGHYKGCI